MVVHRSSKSVESVRITHAAQSPDGVTGNTSEFESDILSSNLSPVSNKMLALLAYRQAGEKSIVTR